MVEPALLQQLAGRLAPVADRACRPRNLLPSARLCLCLQVAAVSRRILALQQLLGGGDIDVVWMLVREPRLLSADFRRWG